jgi:hypothetical protein
MRNNDTDNDWIVSALERYQKQLLRYAAWLLEDVEKARISSRRRSSGCAGSSRKPWATGYRNGCTPFAAILLSISSRRKANPKTSRTIYSLKPPRNPNKFDALAGSGQRVFAREGCAGCHTPPLYTNNKLTIATGFKPPEDQVTKYDIMNVSVGTDPDLALIARRGTGYYKVPSLKGRLVSRALRAPRVCPDA